MLLRFIILAMSAAIWLSPATAGQNVVIIDQAGIEPSVRGVFFKELALLIGHRDVRFRWSNFVPETEGEIQLWVRPGILDERPEALGAARLENGSVAPDLSIFPRAIAARLGRTSNGNVLGRALARVASHEIIHYLDQSPGHHPEGLMREVFSSDELASEDPTPFRRISLGR